MTGPKMEQLEARQLLAVQTYSGQLSGKFVFTSAGHGWQYNTTLGRYATDRGDNNEIVEDFGNQDQMSYYADYALRAGATVIPMRPVGHQTKEVVLDNDSAGVTFTGAWSNSSSTKYYDEDYGSVVDTVPYRFASTTATGETALATYTPNIPGEGFYPVYTWVLRSTDRTSQLYRINHTGGQTEIRVDHSKVGSGWVYLGTYHFDNGSSAANGSVQIVNNGTAGKVVIADAIRFGNGMGDYIWTNSGATTVSGYPREDENSFHWIARSIGVGTTLSTVIGTTGSANVSAPSDYAEYMFTGNFGDAVYISFHSNAGGGRGAVGLIDTDTVDRTPNQSNLALFLGRQVNTDMQALNGSFEYDWSTRTTHTFTGQFGETNLGANAEFDATIIEVAFHDDVQDAALMRDPKVRDQVARSVYEGTVEYFNNYGGVSTPVSQPNTPQSPRATANTNGSITLNWFAPTTRLGGPAAPTGYRIYQSRDGLGFSDPITVGSGTTTYTIPAANLDSNAYYFKVAAYNTGGEGLGSAVVGARKNGTGGGSGGSRILIVNGFDRYERTQNERQAYAFTGDGLVDRVRIRYNNTFDYIVQAGEAVEAYNVGGAGLGFDTAQNEHVINGQVNLNNYQTVIWLSGEESTDDETFSSTEQTLVNGFLANGGRLFVSGAEIGWNLDRPSGPTAADRSFYNNALKADFVSDDAGTYTTVAASGGIFNGISSIVFDNGSKYYDAEFPDVLAPVGGSVAALNYSGGTGGVAAIQYDGGANGPRVVTFGFPFETITNVSRRTNIMQRVLDFFGTAITTSATPGVPTLAGGDSGVAGDNLTNHDNSSNSSAKTLDFAVPGVTIGATVRIYADGILIGSKVADLSTTTVTTSGSFDLIDGAHSITATQQIPSANESTASGALQITIDTVAPKVLNFYVGGSAWLASFKSAAGMTSDGYAVPSGANQLKTLPWINLNRVSVQFNDAVIVDQNDLALYGAASATYTTSGFSYNIGSNVGTWSLPASFGAEKVRARLDASTLTAITDAAGNQLDGEWVDGSSSFSSGNGVQGGDFSFRFNVLPGDVNQNTLVQSNDGLLIQGALLTTPGVGAYTIYKDVNGNGLIQSNDFLNVQSRLLTTLPAGEPGDASLLFTTVSPRSSDQPVTLVTSDIVKKAKKDRTSIRPLPRSL